MGNPQTQKKKSNKRWFPPREMRGIYRFRKKFPYLLEVLNEIALPNRLSLFIRHDISTWLTMTIGFGLWGYQVTETSVLFGFKSQESIDKFENFLEEAPFTEASP